MLITYSDAYEVTHQAVGTVLSVQHMDLHITYGSEAAPFSELDQVTYRVVWTPLALYLRNRPRLLATTMRSQSLEENTIVGARGGNEDASLDEEDDRIYRDEVKHEP
jgi:hypothetical protein